MKPRPYRNRLARLRGNGALQMTSMMDILVTLLLFVLKGFVVGGEVHVPPPGVELPKSTSVAAPQASIVVAIDDDAILVNAVKVASVSETRGAPDLMIRPLDERIQEMLAQIEAIERAGGAPAVHLVTIQGDREIEFEILEKVMYTLQQNGFERISLAVLKSA